MINHWSQPKIKTNSKAIEAYKKPFSGLGKIFKFTSTIPKKELTYSQAKERFPKLKAMGDTDRDGVKNWNDCRPFNKKKQDEVMNMDDTIVKRNPLPRRVDFYKNETQGDESLVYKETRWREFGK